MAEMSVTKTCPLCGKKQTLSVDEKAYKAWLDGKMSIQEAFPNMNVDDREVLKTGICVPCWNNMFKEEDNG